MNKQDIVRLFENSKDGRQHYIEVKSIRDVMFADGVEVIYDQPQGTFMSQYAVVRVEAHHLLLESVWIAGEGYVGLLYRLVPEGTAERWKGNLHRIYQTIPFEAI